MERSQASLRPLAALGPFCTCTACRWLSSSPLHSSPPAPRRFGPPGPPAQTPQESVKGQKENILTGDFSEDVHRQHMLGSTSGPMWPVNGPTPSTPPFIHHRQGGHRQNGFTPGDHGQEELRGKGGGWNKGTFPSGFLLLGNIVLDIILGSYSLAFFQTLCFPSQQKIFPLSFQSNFFFKETTSY